MGLSVFKFNQQRCTYKCTETYFFRDGKILLNTKHTTLSTSILILRKIIFLSAEFAIILNIMLINSKFLYMNNTKYINFCNKRVFE